MPRIVDHDAQRELLLDACFRLFAREGYAAASMRKLAKAAGVSTGTLYHYFPDKRALLSGMLQLLVERDESRVQVTLPEGAGVAVRIRLLVRFVDEHQGYLRDLLRIAMEVHRHEPEPASRQLVSDAIGRYRRAIAQILGIDQPDLIKLAFSFLVGALVHGLLDPDGVDFDRIEAMLQDTWSRLAESYGSDGAD